MLITEWEVNEAFNAECSPQSFLSAKMERLPLQKPLTHNRILTGAMTENLPFLPGMRVATSQHSTPPGFGGGDPDNSRVSLKRGSVETSFWVPSHHKYELLFCTHTDMVQWLKSTGPASWLSRVSKAGGRTATFLYSEMIARKLLLLKCCIQKVGEMRSV